MYIYIYVRVLCCVVSSTFVWHRNAKHSHCLCFVVSHILNKLKFIVDALFCQISKWRWNWTIELRSLRHLLKIFAIPIEKYLFAIVWYFLLLGFSYLKSFFCFDVCLSQAFFNQEIRLEHCTFRSGFLD